MLTHRLVSIVVSCCCITWRNEGLTFSRPDMISSNVLSSAIVALGTYVTSCNIGISLNIRRYHFLTRKLQTLNHLKLLYCIRHVLSWVRLCWPTICIVTILSTNHAVVSMRVMQADMLIHRHMRVSFARNNTIALGVTNDNVIFHQIHHHFPPLPSNQKTS